MNKNLPFNDSDDELLSLPYNQNERDQLKKPQFGPNLFQSLLSTGCQNQLFNEIGNNLQMDQSQICIQKLRVDDFGQSDIHCLRGYIHKEKARNHLNKDNRLQDLIDEQYKISQEEQSHFSRKQRNKNRKLKIKNKVTGNSKNILVAYKTIFKSYFETKLEKDKMPKIFYQKEYLNLDDFSTLVKITQLRSILQQMFDTFYIQRQLQLSRCVGQREKLLYLKKQQKFRSCFQNGTQLTSIM